MSLPVWWLVDEDDNVVASFRAETALEARDEFRRQGLSGVRVTPGRVAPVDETAAPGGAFCEGCHRPVNEATDYRRVTGWERITRNGAGGTHAIRAPDRTSEEFMCMFCVDKLANGVSLQQQTLV
jgi:hypothetical protein